MNEERPIKPTKQLSMGPSEKIQGRPNPVPALDLEEIPIKGSHHTLYERTPEKEGSDEVAPPKYNFEQMIE